MRWVLVSARHHPAQGGIGAAVASSVDAAVRAGWEVDLITRPPGGRGGEPPPATRVHFAAVADDEPAFAARIEGLRRLELIRPYRYGLWALAAARALLDLDGRPDAIELVDCQAEGCVALGERRVRERFAGVPMIVHAHTPMFLTESLSGADPARFGRAVYHGWERDALLAADGVIAPSRLALARLPALERTAVVPCPVLPAPIAPASPRELIALLGEIHPGKGVDLWCRSLARVFAARSRAQAVVAGADTASAPDGSSMREHCRRLLGPALRDRCRFAGALEHQEALRLIGQAAVVVVPSLHESFSYAAAEALSRGRAVIVSDRVGIIEHAPSVAVVPAGDVAALAEAQIAALADPRAARRRARRAREELLESASPARHLRGKADFAESLAGFPPREAPGDGFASMTRFLAEVEAIERRAAPALAAAG